MAERKTTPSARYSAVSTSGHEDQRGGQHDGLACDCGCAHLTRTAKTAIAVGSVCVVLVVVGVPLAAYFLLAEPGDDVFAGLQNELHASAMCIKRIDPVSAASAYGESTFSWRIYRSLTAFTSPDQNMVISPLGIVAVMTMAASAAKGLTQDEIKSAANLPCLDTDMLDGFKIMRNSVLSGRSPNGSFVLEYATKMFLDKRFNASAQFQARLNTTFMGGPDRVNFSQVDVVRKTINDWVEMRTKSKIKDFVPIGALKADSLMLIANAVYFRGKWAVAFSGEHTEKDADFYAPDRSVTKVDMMVKEDHLESGEVEGLDARLIKLPYHLAISNATSPRSVSMYIVLPNLNSSLSALEAHLADLDLADLDKHLRSGARRTLLSLPKMRLEHTAHLVSPLRRLGARTAFDPDRADFSSMLAGNDEDASATADPLFVTDLVQKVYLEVSEGGTEAAAATAAFAKTTAAESEPRLEFECNRPFLIVIRDDRAKVVLFIGRFVKGVK